jgi:hypothetical protein
VIALAARARLLVGSSSHVLSPAHVIRSAIRVIEPPGGGTFVTPIERSAFAAPSPFRDFVPFG